MKRALPFLLLGLPLAASAQRYVTEVFTPDQVVITPGVSYGQNVDFLTSNLADPDVPADLGFLQMTVSQGNPIPPEYFNPLDTSTAVKVADLKMDIYEPDQAVDTETARPMVLYLHTGNALPPGYPGNGSPTGRRTDSTAVEICKQLAQRGYVAVSMSYRLGWNPLGTTLEVRRGTLLNAIYRAIHDVRQCIRTHKAVAANGGNTYAINPDKIVVLGEGTGGYIALANATLDQASELFIEKFVPDPLNNPGVSYIDTNAVGNLDGFNGQLTLYRPNGFDYETQFCVNLGGALADTSWMEVGDVPMVACHTVFDPYAPFTEGTVIVPTTGEEVVPVQGSNFFVALANTYGNNASFATLPAGDPFTDRARSLYGQVVDGVQISANPEGLFPMVRPHWAPPAGDEASPWQWWDPTSPDALDIIPGLNITCHQASLASNPDMSGAKGRAYIDTIMGYINPRIVCELQLGLCSLVSIDENSSVAQGVDLFPNPAADRVTISSTEAAIVSYEVYDVNGRLVRTASVNAKQAVIERQGLQAGAYSVQLRFAEGTVTRKLMLD